MNNNYCLHVIAMIMPIISHNLLTNAATIAITNVQ